MIIYAYIYNTFYYCYITLKKISKKLYNHINERLAIAYTYVDKVLLMFSSILIVAGTKLLRFKFSSVTRDVYFCFKKIIFEKKFSHLYVLTAMK